MLSVGYMLPVLSLSPPLVPRQMTLTPLSQLYPIYPSIDFAIISVLLVHL